MKKLIGILGLAALMAGVAYAPAQAQSLYVEGSAGITTQDQLDWGGGTYDLDDGWNAGVAVGRSNVWTNWDAEVEFSYNEMEYSCCNPNNTNEYRLMANATYNFAAGGFTPYVGGGLGAAWVTYENASGSYEREATVIAYQLIGGVRVPVGERWALFGEYRYQDTFEDPEDAGLEWEHQGHNFAFGARVNLH
ncbi:MAG: outer membrane protein [Hyphomonadaceae bacterium]